jgi:autotransporter-associated beta strand protein
LGAGVLSVTADDTLSGLVTISAGTLQFGNGGPAGSVSNAVGIVDNANLVFDDNNTVSYSNLISGYGGLVQFGSGTLILPNNETYYGNTTVSNGTLEVNGSLAAGGAVTVSTNGTLAGSGAVSGPVTDNGTIAPGSPSTIGTLTVSANPALNGTILMKLNKSVSPSNDVLAVTGMLTYGGTLDLTNIGTGTLTYGDSLKLFSAGSYSGAFSNIVPATAGAGLAWNTSLLAVNGTLSVTYAPPTFAGAVLSGTNFTFLVTDSVAGATNYILTSTNLVLPLTNWTRLATNVFDAGGNLAFTNGVDQNQPARFYLLQLP